MSWLMLFYSSNLQGSQHYESIMEEVAAPLVGALKVHDVSDPSAGVDSLPAIIGLLSNGGKVILKSGISVKDFKSAVQNLSGLLENFEKKNKKVASTKTKHPESGDYHIPLLTGSNLYDICGDKIPVCLIGAFRSSKTRDNLQTFLKSVSQQSFSRKQTAASGPRTTDHS